MKNLLEEIATGLAIIGVAVLGFAAIWASFPSDQKLQNALHAAGYQDVQLTGYRFFACSEDDLFHNGFEAKGAGGVQISGVVCSAPLKGMTIRLD